MTVTKQHLIELGFAHKQARDIIKLAKVHLVNKGFAIYNNKRLGVVPKTAVEQVLGFEIEI
jgi:hypothetical protein